MSNRCPHTMKAKDRNGETYCCDCGTVTKREAPDMKITINGVEHQVPGKTITHEEICQIAGEPDHHHSSADAGPSRLSRHDPGRAEL